MTRENVLDCGKFSYPLPEDVAKAAKECTSDECVLGVRPQNVVVHRDAKGKTGLVKAQLDVTEPLGDLLILDLEVGDSLVKAVVDPSFKAEIGDELWISFPADKIHIFDKKTGSTLV